LVTVLVLAVSFVAGFVVVVSVLVEGGFGGVVVGDGGGWDGGD
jgi:hypothetical protein